RAPGERHAPAEHDAARVVHLEARSVDDVRGSDAEQDLAEDPRGAEEAIVPPESGLGVARGARGVDVEERILALLRARAARVGLRAALEDGDEARRGLVGAVIVSVGPDED